MATLLSSSLLLLGVQYCYTQMDVSASSVLCSILLYHCVVNIFKVCPLHDMWRVPVTFLILSIMLYHYFEIFSHRFLKCCFIVPI